MASVIANLCYSPLSSHSGVRHHRHSTGRVSPRFLPASFSPFSSANLGLSSVPWKPHLRNSQKKFSLSASHGAGDGGGIRGGDGGKNGRSSDGGASGGSRAQNLGIVGIVIHGWRSRVAADPEFPFKVLMEELVGVSSCVLGDMASRPNFGLNELDFVFCTVVVGLIVNFALMYLLAPTASSSSSALPFIFANCPKGHMFENGLYSLWNRLGTFAYKGSVFSLVGFAAGLVGTSISNGLIKIRETMDSDFVTPNKSPPAFLNAATWAIHMGLNSNFRYQALNGIEFLLAKGVNPFLFKSSVLVLRCLNNVVGGMTFVMLARITGSQSSGKNGEDEHPDSFPIVSAVERRKPLDTGENLDGTETQSPSH